MNDIKNTYQVSQTHIGNQVYFILTLFTGSKVMKTYQYRSHSRINDIAMRWMQTGFIS